MTKPRLIAQGAEAKIISLIIGITIIILSVILYISNSPYWFFPAPIGIWLLFDSLSSLRKNKTTLDLLIAKDYKKFFMIYGVLFILGLLIESLGVVILNFWSYALVNYQTDIPSILNRLSKYPLEGLGLFIWPFILMSFREMYNFLHSFIKKNILTVISAMLLGIIIWEIPNIFSKDWVYSIPYITLEIFHINIVVIISWVILILGPLYVYKLLKIK